MPACHTLSEGDFIVWMDLSAEQHLEQDEVVHNI